jgi:hypothetical protein
MRRTSEKDRQEKSGAEPNDEGAQRNVPDRTKDVNRSHELTVYPPLNPINISEH